MKPETLRNVVEPVVMAHDLELDRIEVTPIGKRRLLRVIVDGDGPAGRGPLLDDLARVSAALSAVLDSSEAVGKAPYTLEVTTRGVDAPLLTPAHYRRNRGRLVKLNLAEEELTGRILGVSEDGVQLMVDGAERVVAFVDITKAVVQVEMNRRKED